MIRKLGIIFLMLLIEAPIMALDYFIQNGFLVDFLRNQSLQIMGTALAINIATCAFLVSQLVDMEIRAGKKMFDKSRKQIKDNLYFMLVVFLIHMIVLIGTPVIGDKAPQYLKYIYTACKSANLFLFLLYLFALYEMTQAIFIVGKFIEQSATKSK